MGLCSNSRLAIARLPQETLQIHLIQTVDSAPTLCIEDILSVRDSLMKGGDFHNLSMSGLWYIQHLNQEMQMEDSSASTTENTV